jgi:hypothetical protein
LISTSLGKSAKEHPSNRWTVVRKKGTLALECYLWLATDLEKHIPINEVEFNLRPTVSRPVCLGVRRPSGTHDQFFFLLEISFKQLRVCYFVAPSPTRERVCNLL